MGFWSILKKQGYGDEVFLNCDFEFAADLLAHTFSGGIVQNDLAELLSAYTRNPCRRTAEKLLEFDKNEFSKFFINNRIILEHMMRTEGLNRAELSKKLRKNKSLLMQEPDFEAYCEVFLEDVQQHKIRAMKENLIKKGYSEEIISEAFSEYLGDLSLEYTSDLPSEDTYDPSSEDMQEDVEIAMIAKEYFQEITVKAQRVIADIEKTLSDAGFSKAIMESTNKYSKKQIHENSVEQHRMEFEILCYAIFLATNQTRRYLIKKDLKKDLNEKLCRWFDGALVSCFIDSCGTGKYSEFQDDIAERLTNYQAAENKETAGSLQTFTMLMGMAAVGPTTENPLEMADSYVVAGHAGAMCALAIGKIAMRAMKNELSE